MSELGEVIAVTPDRHELYAQLARGMAQLAGELSVIEGDVSPSQDVLPLESFEPRLGLLAGRQRTVADWEPKWEDISQLYHSYVCLVREMDYLEGDEFTLHRELIPGLVDNFALDEPRDFTIEELQKLHDSFVVFMENPRWQDFRQQVVKDVKESE